MKKVVLSTLLIAALLSGCSTSRKAQSLAGEWDIVSVNGKTVSSDNDPFLGFDIKEGRLYGNAGCNNIMATVSVDSKNESIKLSEVGATRKMCRDMKLEGMVLEALGNVSAYRTTKTGVELVDAQGRGLMMLQKRGAASLSDLEGEWLITSVDGNKVKVVEETPFIVFDIDGKSVHGTGGCNIFNGGFTQDKKDPASLKFGQLVTTMKAGPGMEQEGKILPAFDRVRSFVKHTDGTIVLKDAEDKEVIVLKKNTEKSLTR